MDDSLRSKIYKQFDEKGIHGIHLASLAFSVETSDLDSIPYTERRIFEPDSYEFGLSKSEIEQLIIDYVYDTVNVRISSINELMRMRSLNGKPFFLLLDSPKAAYCLALSKIPLSVTFRKGDGIKTLGYIEEINESVGFIDSEVEDLGNLKRIKEDFLIWGDIPSKLYSLENLEFVGGDLNLKRSNIVDFGKLNYVGGNLNLRHRNPFPLGNLKLIGGNLLLSKNANARWDLSGIRVGGKVKYFND